MSEDWGPWIDYDGGGCPVPDGTWIEVEGFARAYPNPLPMPRRSIGAARRDQYMWHRKPLGLPMVVRYRVYKPRALQQLIDLAENLPADKPVEVVE